MLKPINCWKNSKSNIQARGKKGLGALHIVGLAEWELDTPGEVEQKCRWTHGLAQPGNQQSSQYWPVRNFFIVPRTSTIDLFPTTGGCLLLTGSH